MKKSSVNSGHFHTIQNKNENGKKPKNQNYAAQLKTHYQFCCSALGTILISDYAAHLYAQYQLCCSIYAQY